MTVQASDESEQPEQRTVMGTCSELGCSNIVGCCVNASVGGVVVSVNKFDLIAPYLGLGLAIITPAIAIGTAKHIKRRKTQR
jgi:hypothetical protein